MVCQRVDTEAWADGTGRWHRVFVPEPLTFKPATHTMVRPEQVSAFLDSDEASGRVVASSLTFHQGRYGTMYWFDDADTAFACKMRFG